MRKSFLTCKHKNQQDFTNYCFDCGYNIYTTEEEYLEDLRDRADSGPVKDEIRKLERKLGIVEEETQGDW